ncbi:glycoside hydrolase family 88 protein [Draconibacterium mangrovi]|uniref:glycoside hydrolase family 88 protein n=1 Tax=Draconibacterium mangrovi TaxID=2697469 RepID=UPI0013CF64CF|nr:glycoside hydrolase family 88 protein [Draconibacterium mangrovi]
MKNLTWGALLFLMVSCGVNTRQPELKTDDLLNLVEEQLSYQLHLSDSLRTATFVSPRSVENEKIKMSRLVEWTSGFFPGELWQMYEYTKNDKWKIAAKEYTSKLEPMQYNTRTHDLGFMMYCSYGKGYEIKQNEAYQNILLQSANSLISRFDSTVGCIRSWDHGKDKWEFPVIIDNMMNLELLYWASEVSGDSKYKDIANKHALTTLTNHFREDNSCYHVIDYDPKTGKVRNKTTAQGYSDESAWARGQAWALYGYTMCYRKTGIPAYLKQAQNVAEYIMNHNNQADDLIPYWDYDVPEKTGEPRDASAAAITASALIELQTLTNNYTYVEYARELLTSLASSQYMAKPGTNWGFVLKHSTGSVPHNSEIDEPLVYADYYFIEALLRLKNIDNNN